MIYGYFHRSIQNFSLHNFSGMYWNIMVLAAEQDENDVILQRILEK